MISKKDSREEKRQQEKEEEMNAFMEIERRRLEMDVERQAKMLELEEAKQAKILELEEAKQAKMLEIEATNSKTKAKEVTLASMKTSMEIMKVDLNTMSLRKRLWFEKMRAKMLKFDQL
ncbi:Protein UXT-like protein [Hordeum vulgare]|nr:Protein UXT-like protein [Hordeum vulgare]